MSTDAKYTQAVHTLRLIMEQGLDTEEVETLHIYLPCLAKAIKQGRVLSPAEFDRVPVITVTGEEELELPSWVVRIEEDVTEPTGILELEIIELLGASEDHVTSSRMLSRAQSKDANLGLRHAQAFLARYQRKDFDLPVGAYILFPGTVVIQERTGNDRRIPYLKWDGKIWHLRWRWLGIGFRGHVSLVRYYA